MGTSKNQPGRTETNGQLGLKSARNKAAGATSIVLAFLSVYFFWGSTYTAIRIGAAEMPALLLAGLRFFIAGIILLAWCRWRRLKIAFPVHTMFMLGIISLLLLRPLWLSPRLWSYLSLMCFAAVCPAVGCDHSQDPRYSRQGHQEKHQRPRRCTGKTRRH